MEHCRQFKEEAALDGHVEAYEYVTRHENKHPVLMQGEEQTHLLTIGRVLIAASDRKED